MGYYWEFVMSIYSDGIEAYDKGKEPLFDNPYPYGDDRHEKWVDGWIYGSKCDLAEELPEI